MVKQRSKTLSSRGNELADTFYQLKVISFDLPFGKNGQKPENIIPPFEEKLQEAGLYPLHPHGLQIFQINIGKLCNQSCAHCHVDAGPDKKRENMSRETLERCLQIIAAHPQIETVDITGGAPEMNPHFRWFVEEVSKLGRQIINRCNLTIIVSNPKFRDLPDFFARHKVQVVSSLPHYNRLRTDRQRGEGVFEASIEALKMLNAVGYGMEGSELELHLVYNPSGAFLPAGQACLEADFKQQLKRKYGISFHRLLTITNLPVSRFLEYLLESGQYESYMETLHQAFNPATLQGLMCRNMVSVSWDGYLYDCDFNQMLDLKVQGTPAHLDDFDIETFVKRPITVNRHCYGCTAGAGSSCGGEVV